jgi:hypothetical protein
MELSILTCLSVLADVLAHIYIIYVIYVSWCAWRNWCLGHSAHFMEIQLQDVSKGILQAKGMRGRGKDNEKGVRLHPKESLNWTRRELCGCHSLRFSAY